MALKRTPIPTQINLPDGGKRLELEWEDGRKTQFNAFDLRAECPCASCVDEMTGKRILRREDVDAEVAASSYGKVGRYAIQIQWSDGHSTGIYTYDSLRGDQEN